MLNLQAAVTTAWLMENGSEDIAQLLRRQRIDEPPDLTRAIDAFGQALNASIAGGAEPLYHALHDGMAGEFSQVMAYLDSGRRLRLLHWLTNAGFEQPEEIINLLTGPTTPCGHSLLRWIAALLRREQLDRLFSAERIHTLQAACRKARHTEQSQ